MLLAWYGHQERFLICAGSALWDLRSWLLSLCTLRRGGILWLAPKSLDLSKRVETYATASSHNQAAARFALSKGKAIPYMIAFTAAGTAAATKLDSIAPAL